MPKVSILVPTFEPDPKHLTEALASIQAQTFTDFTVFIRDDASSADVKNMVKPFLSDSRFHFAESSSRHGIGGNWNACLSKAESEFVQFLFQDDIWNPTYLEQSVRVLELNPSIGFTTAYHDYLVEGPEEYIETTKPFYNDVARAQQESGRDRMNASAFLEKWIRRGLRPNVIGEPSFVLLRRELILKVGMFAEELDQILDMEYWIRCLQHTSSLYRFDESLGTFRVHAHGATAVHARAKKRNAERKIFFRLHPILSIRALLHI